jgi:hypothetical protein
MSEKVFHPELNRLMNLALGEKVYDEYEVDDEGNYIMKEGNDE